MTSKTTNKYSPEVRARAVRMVIEHEAEHPSRWAAISSIAAKIGCSAHTLNGWIKRAEVDRGKRAGLPGDVAARMKALERENRELRRANATLRKIPSQRRSEQTIDVIVEAVFQLVEEVGEAGLTTTGVAQRAGVSIGTLYQYFEDRDSLLLAYAQRQRRIVVEEARRLMKTVDPEHPDSSREVIRLLIRAFALQGTTAHHFAHFSRLRPNAGVQMREEFSRLLAERWNRNAPGDETVNRVRAYVLTRAVFGALQFAAMDGGNHLEGQAFEDALCTIVGALEPPAGRRRCET